MTPEKMATIERLTEWNVRCQAQMSATGIIGPLTADDTSTVFDGIPALLEYVAELEANARRYGYEHDDHCNIYDPDMTGEISPDKCTCGADKAMEAMNDD